MSHFDLHLLLGRAVPVPDDADDAAQLHHLAEGGGHYGRVVELEGHRPRDVQGGRQLTKYHITQDLGAVVIVLVRVLYERETVHVAYERFAVRPVDKTYSK